jgi:folylpolyglutamate synthase/dihydropteroate synthase
MARLKSDKQTTKDNTHYFNTEDDNVIQLDNLSQEDIKSEPKHSSISRILEDIRQEEAQEEKDAYQYPFDISILIDYAHEPESMSRLLTSLTEWKKAGLYNFIIHIVSCDGAGRDDWKKPIMGQTSLELADFTVVTIDNYDKRDKPENILSLLTKNYDKKLLSTKYLQTTKRREAFKLALKEVINQQKKDSSLKKFLIVSTGVGSEKGLTQPQGVIEWDEKKVWQEEFKKFLIEYIKIS